MTTTKNAAETPKLNELYDDEEEVSLFFLFIFLKFFNFFFFKGNYVGFNN